MNKSRKTILVMYRQILSAGGIEKSLFAFFRELKDENIQIRLLLFNYGSDIPEDIYNFVEVCYIDQSLRFPPNKAIGYLIKQKRYLQIILRILITISGHLKIYSFHYFLWRFLDCSISLKYDIAIAYGGVICQNILKYAVDSNKKIVWYHRGEYKNTLNIIKYDRKIYEGCDTIVTVSDGCKEMFAKIFPTIKHKITVIPNYVDSTEVLKKSLHNIDFSTDGIMILSVGRLSAEKGFNLAIEACRLLVDALPDIPFSWYVLGTGADEKKLSSLISFHGLEKKFYLLGENENPYPYMRMADIFVQPSYYEADSIVIHEAIILKKLIVATRTHSTARLINHLIDGIIVDISAKSIADGILLLLTDSEIKNTILTNIQNKQIDYSYYKQTLRKLFDL